MELGGKNLLQRKFEGDCTKVINDYWHWKIMSKLFTSIMKVNNELKWIRTKEDKRSAIGHFKRDHEWMRFRGYRNDMFLMFLCNHVQYEFIFGMVQILLLSILYITLWLLFFWNLCMLFTHDQLILFYLMSAWSVKSMFISMFVNLYDEFLCYNLQWYFIVIFINI